MPAALGNQTPTAVPTHHPDLPAWAEDFAVNLEARRREVTLVGGLLLIPATMLVVVAGMAALGVTGAWLVLCAMMGLCVGPAVCLGFLASSFAAGRPLLYRAYRHRLLRAGLTGEEARATWHAAIERLDRHDMLLAGRDSERLVLGDQGVMSV